MTAGTCFRCGNDFSHDPERPCPALGQSCAKCKKLGHFAKVCQAKQSRISFVGESSSDKDQEESVYIQSALSLIGSVGKTDKLVDVISDFGTIQFDIDTGANVTLLD